MPNNHSKYGIPGIAAVGGTPVGPHRDHCGAAIQAPGALAGEALDLKGLAAEKLMNGPGGVGLRHARQDHLPERRFQRKRAQRGRSLQHLDHVNPVWQGRVKPFPDLGYGTAPRERKLQVLGLARRPCRGRASVGNLRVRRESGGIGDGQPCPANSPFNGTRDIPVAGETHLASFSVPDNQLAGHRGHARPRHARPRHARPRHARPRHARPRHARPRHAQAPARDGTTGTGSNVAPVGPVWISVPMAGQTPQS